MAARDFGEVREEVSLAHLIDSAPVRSSGRFGRPGDAWNLLFIGEEDAVAGALAKAGWTRIPIPILASLREGIGDLLSGRVVARFPPMNDYHVRGKTQDHNWAIVVRPILARHHFRLWRLAERAPGGAPYWWGSGNYDLDVRWWDFSHIPDPDMNLERDYIAETLRGSPWVERIELIPAPRVPREGSNDKGYAFRTDGRILAVTTRAGRAGR